MANVTTENNPLLNPFTLKDHAVPFDLIKTEHFMPALEVALQQARKNIADIKLQKQITFENTILALESASEKADTISSIYFNLFSAEANEAHQALAQQISPMLSAFSSDVSLDAELFYRIKFVYDHLDKLNLNPEQSRLTEKMYLDFARNGAQLAPEKKERLRVVDQELSILGPQFAENTLKATNAFELWIDDKKDLAGLPEGAIEAAAQAAIQKGKRSQWLFTLNVPSLMPFLMYGDNVTLREKLWRATSSKSFGGEFDNQGIIQKMVELRYERSQLLGYNTYADYVLEERMAKSTETVFNFLKRLIEPSKKAAEKDLQELKDFRLQLESNSEIKPWDFAYYSEKLKEKKYAFNDEELRPYFKLENVVEGVFEHARRLFGLTFKPVSDLPVYHPDVKTFEVYDQSTNDYVGLFYMDFFPRETKKGGAWMTNYREQGTWFGRVQRPHVSIVCNFTKPTPTKPSL